MGDEGHSIPLSAGVAGRFRNQAAEFLNFVANSLTWLVSVENRAIPGSWRIVISASTGFRA
jgi:hypothetical protein